MKRQIKRKDKFFVYMVQCRNGYYYTGYTNNLKDRLKLHNSGYGAKYLRGKGPVKLVYVRKYRYYKNAINAEREIKSYTRRKKKELIKIYAKNK